MFKSGDRVVWESSTGTVVNTKEVNLPKAEPVTMVEVLFDNEPTKETLCLQSVFLRLARN